MQPDLDTRTTCACCGAKNPQTAHDCRSCAEQIICDSCRQAGFTICPACEVRIEMESGINAN